MRKFILFGAALFTISGGAFALEKTDEEALRDTQKLLSDEEALKAFAKDNKDAQGALKQVDQLTGGDQRQKAEINAISSSAFTKIVNKHNGDAAAIQEELQGALKNPEAFFKSLPAEEQARIRALASEIDKKNGASAAAPAASK